MSNPNVIQLVADIIRKNYRRHSLMSYCANDNSKSGMILYLTQKQADYYDTLFLKAVIDGQKYKYAVIKGTKIIKNEYGHLALLHLNTGYTLQGSICKGINCRYINIVKQIKILAY